MLRRVPRVPGLKVVVTEAEMQVGGTLVRLGVLMDFVEMD